MVMCFHIVLCGEGGGGKLWMMWCEPTDIFESESGIFRLRIGSIRPRQPFPDCFSPPLARVGRPVVRVAARARAVAADWRTAGEGQAGAEGWCTNSADPTATTSSSSRTRGG